MCARRRLDGQLADARADQLAPAAPAPRHLRPHLREHPPEPRIVGSGPAESNSGPARTSRSRTRRLEEQLGREPPRENLARPRPAAARG